MPTNVEEIKTLELDGKSIELRPLKIKRLRTFMKEFDKVSKVANDNDKSLDVLIACCAIAMQQYAPEYATKEILEDMFDITDVYLVIEAATGIRLGGDSGNAVAVAPLGTS